MKISSGKLIDFGCGGGQLAILASKISPNCKVIGIDLNPPTLSSKQVDGLSENLEFVRGGLEELDAILYKDNVRYLIFSNCIQYLNICQVNEIIARHPSIQKVFISTAFSKFYWIRFTQAVKQARLREILRYILLLVKSSLIPYLFYAKSKREKPPSFRLINEGMKESRFSLSKSFDHDIWGDKYPWIGNRNLLKCFLFMR